MNPWVISNQSLSKDSLYEKCEPFRLTAKEKEIAYYWFIGIPRVQIANMMQLSENTIKTHIKHISLKVEIRGRACFRKKILNE